MSKKNKPVLIVTSIKENSKGVSKGVYIPSGHNTSGIAIHHLFPIYDWNDNKKAYVKDFEKKFKLKLDVNYENFNLILKKLIY
jgi:hypothetical protein